MSNSTTATVLALLTFCLTCQVTSSFHNVEDPCSNFPGQHPNTSLTKCPNAKFMTSDDYECYDEIEIDVFGGKFH